MHILMRIVKSVFCVMCCVFCNAYSSLSMYYFECCHKLDRQTDDDKKERLIFSTPHGHKHVGTRGFEFDSAYTHFLELFFSVSDIL